MTRRYRMAELDIKEVSFVGSPANRKKYIFIKGYGGDNDMVVALKDLSVEDRGKLEIEVKKSITPDLEKSIKEGVKKGLEESFTKKKREEIATELKVDIEQSLREEFGKQADGVSTEAAAAITSSLRSISTGLVGIGKLVGYGYKAGGIDEKELDDLKKKVDELGAKIITKEDLKEIVAGATV